MGGPISTRILLMIHGMYCQSWCWHNYRDYFESKGYTCITPTLRSHNCLFQDEPDPEMGRISLRDYVDDLKKEIAQLPEKPVIVGHSMGGIIAQMLAEQGMARAIVLLTTAAPAGIKSLKFSVIKGFWSSLTRRRFWEKPLKPTFREAAYSILNLMPPEKQKEIFHKMVYESGRAAFEIGFWNLDRNKTTRINENEIECPVLVVAASKDRITPATVVKQVAKKYSALYREFPDHAHWVLEQKGWGNIAEYILHWLQKEIFLI